MKVKITNEPTPEMRIGGYFYPYPYAGSKADNPFGIVNTENYPISPDTSSIIKAVDKEDANIEAEKGEMLFKFDMGGLYNIKGKRHYDGGTPIVADKGDFIFSRDKDLAITEEEKDLFDFKQKGKYKESENTPAKLLSREVDPKHYNQLLSILNDPNADTFAKKTAELMLGKYQQKIGQVAYIQESKKNFPQGLPEFSKNTAPVDSPEFDDSETKEMMYAKKGMIYGGSDNQDPYAWQGIPFPSPIYDTSLQGNIFSGVAPVRNNQPLNLLDNNTTGVPLVIPVPQGNPMTIIPSSTGIVPKAGDKTSTVQTNSVKGFNGMNIPWNAQEMLATAAPFLSALATPTYYDQLQQKNTPDLRLDRLNNDAEVTAIKQQGSLAQRELFSNTTGKNANLGAAQVRAQTLNQLAQSYAGINNANSQIANNESNINYNAANSDQAFNLQNIYKTGVNNTLSMQRRNEQLTNATTDSLNKGLAVQNSLDTLNQSIYSQVTPYLDKDGNSPIVLDPRTRVPIQNPNWHGDILNNPFIGSGTSRDTSSKYLQLLDQAILSGNTDQINAISRAIAAINKQTRNQPSILSRVTQ